MAKPSNPAPKSGKSVNVSVDQALLAKAKQVLGVKGSTEAVHAALTGVIQRAAGLKPEQRISEPGSLRKPAPPGRPPLFLLDGPAVKKTSRLQRP
jgi:hypothetical protein